MPTCKLFARGCCWALGRDRRVRPTPVSVDVMKEKHAKMPDERDLQQLCEDVGARLTSAGWELTQASGTAVASIDRPMALLRYDESGHVAEFVLCADRHVLALLETNITTVGVDAILNQLLDLKQKIHDNSRESNVQLAPFLYVTDGQQIYFLDTRRMQNRPRRVSAFHTPYSLRDLATRDLDSELASLDNIATNERLRIHQRDAIRAIESAISAGDREMFVSMAVGTGKTYTAINEIYRLMKARIAKRVLYVVSHRALADQAIHAFTSLEVETGQHFDKVYSVYLNSASFRAPLLSTRSDSRSSEFVLISTVQQLIVNLRKQFPERSAGRLDVPVDAYDLIVADELPLVTAVRRGVRLRTLNYFDAIKLEITSDPTVTSTLGRLVFKYGLESAIRDGLLVDYPEARVRSPANTWPAFNPDDRTYAQRRVFLSYVKDDANDARRIAEQLRSYGLNVWFHDWVSHAGRDFTREILTEISSSDILVVLLSPTSVASPWIREELNMALERRGIELVPALLKPCLIPRSLADRALVDVTQGIDGLLRRLQVGAKLNLTALDSRRFEELVVQLLRRLHFDVDEEETPRDKRYDLRAVYQDPYGFAEPMRYLIEVKFSKNERPSVHAIHQLAEAITSREPGMRGLLVTNGQLTSVAAETLQDLNSGSVRLKIIDGPLLKTLLLAHADLLDEFSPSTKGYQ
jgi:TIR domain/Type III restriction enzyme, res subunit/Restriction endonuclease